MVFVVIFVDQVVVEMSKNTRNTAFRKVDVDKYEEERYEEEIVSDEGVTAPNDTEVQSLLSKYPLIPDPALFYFIY